jgi:hypothetical protein
MKDKKQNDRGSRVDTRVKVSKQYHWKLLTALVDDLKGYLSPEDVELLTLIIRTRDLAAYLLLDDCWGLQSIGPCSEDADFQKLKARYQVASLLKKYLPEKDTFLDSLALEKFMQAEEVCARYNRENHKRLSWGKTDFAIDVFTYARSFLLKLLGTSVPMREVCDGSRHGPGSNLDTKNGLCGSFDKYHNWPYSCTRSAVGYARVMIQRDKRWLGALYESYRERNKIPQHYPIDNEAFWESTFNLVDHNRVTFVPKNAKISRSIAIEPAMNLMLQLGVDGVIRKRLKRWGIDLDDQGINQRLARLGAVTGGLATLDLSAASDSISMKVCELLLPADWYLFLCKLRAPSGLLSDGSLLQYEKMSSMGNGYTFALESAIFAAIIYAVFKTNGRKPKFGFDSAVFGDDLIVPTELFESVTAGLNLAGFTVNAPKSFNKGPVRESCGSDWFHGLSIRPVFLSTPPVTVQDLFVDFNRLKRSLDLRFGIVEPECCKLILSWVPKQFLLWGPFSDEVFDSWLHTDIEGVWSKGFYRFARLLKQPKQVQRVHYSDFLFRKLMHNLKDAPPRRFFEKRLASGSRFTVIAKGFTVRQKPATSSKWLEVYREDLPSISLEPLQAVKRHSC